MKHLILPLTVIIITMSNTNAQKNITGEYALDGVMETAAAFKLNSDSGFEFYFSYGALDRYGSGKWTIKNDRIVFTGKPRPGQDFKLENTNHTKENFSSIQLVNKNPYLYNFVYCRVFNDGKDSIFSFDNDGLLALPYPSDSIHLLCEICPERYSSFQLQKEPAEYTFSFEPWIAEIFFDNNEFLIKDGYLEGKLPVAPDNKSYRFIKQEE